MKYLPSLLFLILLVGCNTVLEKCDCEKVKIYGHPSNILTPIRVTAESILTTEPNIIVDSTKIHQLISELKNLDRIDFDGEVDNRFLIELDCREKNSLKVESNSYITRMNGASFAPTDSFIDLVDELTAN